MLGRALLFRLLVNLERRCIVNTTTQHKSKLFVAPFCKTLPPWEEGKGPIEDVCRLPIYISSAPGI
jgi:hypothetical protein